MFKVSMKGLLAHKTRLLLTALAVIMATAFLSSTYIFSDTIQNTFNNLFADAFRNTNAYVRSSNVIEADFGNKQRDRHAGLRHRRGQGRPGRLRRAGRRQGFASIIGKDGKPLVSGQTAPPTFGSRRAHGRPGRRGASSRAPARGR